MSKGNKTKVLFVCLGNICRSPTAHAVFQAYVDKANLSNRIEVDSAGTAAYHIGHSPDERSVAAAQKRGFDLTPLRARQANTADFSEFDYILAMDKQNLADLRDLCPPDYQGHLGLFLDFADAMELEVPDPYYGGASGFDHVLDLVEDASQKLLTQVKQA